VFFLFPVQKLIIRVALKKLLNTQQTIKKVLIVGARDIGMDFYNRFIKNKHYGFQLAGFVDDRANTTLNGHYLGKTSEIETVITNHELDEIIWTLPMAEEHVLKTVVTVGEKAGKRIRIIQDYQSLGISNSHVDRLGNFAIITVRNLPLDKADNKMAKRLFDIVFSFLVIVLVLSWLMPIISLLIKLGSKGPVFFKQERWGLNTKPIICYKFRTMVADNRDVDENGNYLQACKDDHRVTRIGKFLRKTSLDELPQFFNVLFGSMSVSGPRPHPVPLNLESKDSIENYLMRHWVKPGITGWAQTQGFRGETRNPYRMQKRVTADLWYIENWTFWLDLQIILQTLVNIVKGEENAY
jgi:putative colanic acid biosynthesis UDP-glucose lipid carrier transferase